MNDIEPVKIRILKGTSLASLIGGYIPLERRGGRLVALCPFHAEKTPSFYLYESSYYCFGCHAHGDAISWVQHFENLNFIKALKWLAAKFQIPASELEQPTSLTTNPDFVIQQKKFKILNYAQQFFCKMLWSQEGEEARRYLESRGFKEEFIKEHGFGYAPDEPHKLASYLRGLGITLEEMESSSLINHYERKVFDFFRHRVMIPIRDSQGKSVAFGGRALSSQQMQKYKNSRYDKSSIVFGLDIARKTIRTKARVIIVEGYLDALQLWQHDITETVACQGTALSKEHISQLASLTQLIYLIFDGDQAGQRAMLKTAQQAMDFPNVEFKVVELPKEHDPDSFLRTFGREAMINLLSKSKDLLDFSISNLIATQKNESSIPKILEEEILPWLKEITHSMKRDYIIEKISLLSGISKETIRHALKPLPGGKQTTPSATHIKKPNEVRHKPLKINPFSFDLLGQLYFAKPGELDIEKTRLLLKKINIDEGILAIAEYCLKALEDEKIPEGLIEPYLASSSPQLVTLFERLKNRREAFIVEHRQKNIDKLQLIDKQHKIKESIQSLKSEISQLNLQIPEEKQKWSETAQAIQTLSKEQQAIGEEISEY